MSSWLTRNRATQPDAEPTARAVGSPSEEARPADVQLREVVKRFGEVVAVAGVDLSIPSGRFYSLLGPSGSGKTTCLRLVAGFEQPDGGEVLIGGRPVAGVPPYRRDVNTVFQHYALFPHMDVAANVGYGLRQRRPKLERREFETRVRDALALVRLAGLERRRVWELSGGQQQRVALARALVNHPRVLLLDEPLGALDLKLRKQMQLELKRIQHEVGITFVYVTHDQEEALAMSDRIAVMDAGRIVQEGTPTELYHEPRERFVASFVGECNFFAGQVMADEGGRVALRTDRGVILSARAPSGGLAPRPASRAVVAVRPEYVTVTRGPGRVAGDETAAFAGRVVEATFLGDQVEYHVETEPLGRLLARASSAGSVRGAGFAVGDEVVVRLDESASLALADGEDEATDRVKGNDEEGGAW